nr:unnamed protein product [Callosobruchus chinensis]
MELEENNQLAFLDVLVMRQQGRLNHKVYRNPTHTDRYLHKLSNHHPTQKAGIIKTLSERAKRICAPAYLEEEQEHLEQVLMGNGYSKSDIIRAMNPRRRINAEEQPTQKALPDNEQDSDEEPDEGANEELATLEFLDSSNTSNSASTSRENTPNPPGLENYLGQYHQRCHQCWKKTVKTVMVRVTK